MSKKAYKNSMVVIFLLPAMLLFLSVLIAPIAMSVYYSLFDMRNSFATSSENFVGFQNYVDLLTGDRPMIMNLFDKYILGKEVTLPVSSFRFWKALENSLLLAILSVFLQLPMSLGLALMLGRGIKGERGFLSLYFMPVLISTTVIGQLWKKIYNPSYGILNAVLGMLGFDYQTIMPAGGWLGNANSAIWCVFVPTLWQYVGYHMLLMYAGVRSVSPELREAAKLDGATEGQVDRYVVLPSIKPIIKVSVIFAVTGSLKSFDLLYILNPGGDMNFTTKVPSTLMYNLLFLQWRYGTGSAIAVMMIILCFAFALIISAVFKEREGHGRKKHSEQKQ